MSEKNFCYATDVSTARRCGKCGAKATPETIARWFIDEDPAWDRCDLHHPYNGDPEKMPNGWSGCLVNGVMYALHLPCLIAFIVPQEHTCFPAAATQETR